jgi:glycosyltransferase involved in cell wall biosynthesis
VKILFLNYEYPPLGGGAANATYHLLREISHSHTAINVYAIVSSPATESLEYLGDNVVINKIDIGKNNNLHYQSNFDLITYLFKANKLIGQLLKTEKFDLIHAFFALPCGLLTQLPNRNLPYIISLRGSDVPGYSNRYKFLYPFIKPLFKKICLSASSVVSNSNGLRTLAHKTLLNNFHIEVIPNGIDTDIFHPPEPPFKGQGRLLSVGRLIPRKGFAQLIDSVALLIKEGIDLSLSIAGEGPERSALEDLISKHNLENKIHLLGLCNQEQLKTHYQESDIFVLPSRNEGMSNALLEAMSCGLPVITTNTGGSEELVNDNGIIIEPDSETELTGAIRRLATDKEMRTDFGIESRKRALLFSWKKVADDYIALYRKVLQKKCVE